MFRVIDIVLVFLLLILNIWRFCNSKMTTKLNFQQIFTLQLKKSLAANNIFGAVQSFLRRVTALIFSTNFSNVKRFWSKYWDNVGPFMDYVYFLFHSSSIKHPNEGSVNIKGQYQKWMLMKEFRNAIFTPLMHDAPKWSANAARF